MSDSEEEYEVESIVAAKVETVSKGRRSKPVWKYRIRWKGYTPSEDTWEPVESFVSAEMVPAFWERANTDGRDWQTIGLFKVGEEFLRVGPPRGKKRKSLNPDATEEEPVEEPRQAESSKREETASSVEKRKRKTRQSAQSPERPAKRPRETRQSQPTRSLPPVADGLTTRSKANTLSARKRKKGETPPAPSPEIIPDSEEDAPSLELPPDYVSPAKPGKRKAAAQPSSPAQRPAPVVVDIDSMDEGPTPLAIGPSVDDETPINETLSNAALPAHRARLANPRVRMVNEAEFGALDGGIASKIRALERHAADPSSSKVNSSPKKNKRSKPGPGRSSAGHISLLTADNEGGLQTIKMRQKRSVHASPSPESSLFGQEPEVIVLDDEPKEQLPPPTSEELLQLAGLDTEAAEALSDFEDTAGEDIAPANGRLNAPETIEESSSRSESLDKAKNNLFPFQSPPSPPILPSSWSSTTIFGPLSLGASALPDDTLSVDTPPFKLNLDASVSLSATVSQPHPTTNHFAQKIEQASVPGKFYTGDAATNILSTIRASGESAILTLPTDASSDNKRDFALLHNRLKAGDIFVTANGISTLVLTSSTSPLSLRLNTPAALCQVDQVLVSQVSIENFNGYATAAASADDRRWSQYLADEKLLNT